MGRYITVWRKAPPENNLDWDFYISDNIKDAEQVVKNITAIGVHQYGTYPLGERVAELSSRY